MVALTFPRDYPCSMRTTTCSFALMPMVEVAPLRSGVALADELGPSLWQMEVSSGQLNMADMGVVRGFLDTLSSLNPFNAYDPFRAYPYAYRQGHWNALGGFTGTCMLSTVQSNNVEIGLTLLPVGFIFTAGDYLSFDYGTSRALHRVSVGGVADGAGAVSLEVRPEIRPGWNASSPLPTVSLYRAAAKMLVVPGSVSESIELPAYGRVSFRAIQTL